MRILSYLILFLTFNLYSFDYLKESNGKPIKFDISKPIAYKIINTDLKDSTLYAFNIWNIALDNRITFIEQEGGIIIDLVDSITQTNIVGLSSPIIHNGIIIGGKITILKGSDYKSVMLHEVGHILGMLHAINNIQGYYILADKPVMCPEVSSVTGLTLHVDDILGIRELYGLDNNNLNISLGAIKEKHKGKTVLVNLENSSIKPLWNFGETPDDWSNINKYKYLNKGGYTITAESRGFSSTINIQIGKVKKVKIKKK